MADVGEAVDAAMDEEVPRSCPLPSLSTPLPSPRLLHSASAPPVGGILATCLPINGK